jgi:hypothetical protein
MDGGWEMGIPFLFWYCVKVFRRVLFLWSLDLVCMYVYICICGNKIESNCRIIILRRLLYVKSLAACTL